MTANEIWRIDPEGGEPQRVAGDLGVPDAVKFDAEGFIVSTQVASGQVLRIDPRSGEQTLLAQLNPGLDNLTFVGDRLFVSNFTGEITEILGGGETRTVLPGGLNWPLDLAVGDDGNLYVADGTYFYVVGADGSLETVGMLFTPGYPGFLRGLAPAGPGAFVVTTSGGQVARYRPGDGETDYLADGFDQLYGVAIGPGDTIVFAELGTGQRARAAIGQRGGAGIRTCATRSASRSTPTAVPLVAESGAGRVVRLAGSTETVVDGLQRPQGIHRRATGSSTSSTPAPRRSSRSIWPAVSAAPSPPACRSDHRPVWNPSRSRECRRSPDRRDRSPASPSGRDGTLYVSADGDGSVLALRRVHMTVTPADHRYLQVARTLRKEIVDGVYPVGSQLPTEQQLCERFEVSRYTVREALRRLRDDNLVASRPRAGTLVVPRPADELAMPRT